MAKFIIEGIDISLKLKKKSGKKLAEFKNVAAADSSVQDLRQRVVKFASQFPLPGVFDPSKYQ